MRKFRKALAVAAFAVVAALASPVSAHAAVPEPTATQAAAASVEPASVPVVSDNWADHACQPTVISFILVLAVAVAL